MGKVLSLERQIADDGMGLLVSYRVEQQPSLSRHPRSLGLRPGRLFRRLEPVLVGLGHRVVILPRPEIFPLAMDRTAAFGSARPIHLALSQPGDVRFLKGAYNIGVLQLTGANLQAAPLAGDPFADHKRLLGIFDEIWVGSAIERDVLDEAGLRNVQTIPWPMAGDPAPCDLRTIHVAWAAGGTSQIEVRSLASCLDASETARRFVASVDGTQADVDGSLLLEAFSRLNSRQSIELFVTCDDLQAFNDMRRHLQDRHRAHGICLVPPLDDAAIAGLCARMDFVVWAPRFPASSLFLLDAIAQGCVPVTVAGHALSARSSPAFAATLQADRLSETWETAERARPYGASMTSDDVRTALESALDQSADVTVGRQRDALPWAVSECDVAAVSRRIGQRLTTIRRLIADA